MAPLTSSGIKTICSLSAILLVVVSILGVLDLQKRPWSGLVTDDSGRVTEVAPDSPAQAAGFMIGDSVTMNSGIATDNFAALLQLPRAAVGEVRKYSLARNSQVIESSITFAGLPFRDTILALSLQALGLAFIAIGLWALFRVTNTGTTLLALICLSAAVDLILHPYIPSYTLRLVYMSALNIIVFSGYAFLYHFVIAITRPHDKATSGRRLLQVYWPLAILAILLLLLVVFQPNRSSALFAVAGIVYTAFFVAYLGMIFGTLIYRCVKAAPAERDANNLRLVLFGLVVGLAPGVIAGVFGLVAPTVRLPGSEFYILASIAIPISLARAATRPTMATVQAA